MGNLQRFLFAWELGGGLGHISPLLPLAISLRKRGYHVTLAARDVANAKKFCESQVDQVVAAPHAAHESGQVAIQTNYADILCNNGWGTTASFRKLLFQWRDLLASTRADFVLCDHSPTALLAAHTLRLPAAQMGPGFCCPPATRPLTPFRGAAPVTRHPGEPTETTILVRVNDALSDLKISAAPSLADALFADAPSFLTTFAELDHYSARDLTAYWGTWSLAGGVRPKWPHRSSRLRAFGYLKPYQYTFELLSALTHFDVHLCVYCPGLSSMAKSRLAAQGRISFSEKPVDLERLPREVDFLVLNAGHGSTVAALLAGKPILQVPLYVEQVITAQNVERMGAGLSVSTHQPLTYNQTIETFLDLQPLAEAAERFAKRYQDFHADGQIDALSGALEKTFLERKTGEPTPSKPAGSAAHLVLLTSANDLLLTRILARWPSTPGLITQRHPRAALPWNPQEVDDVQQILSHRFHLLKNAYPGCRIVLDAATYYLNYAPEILEHFDGVEIFCVRDLRDSVVHDGLTFAASQPGGNVNHFSNDRTGFEHHAADVSYPKYATTNLATALAMFYTEYYATAERMQTSHAGRFHLVEADELEPMVRQRWEKLCDQIREPLGGAVGRQLK